MTRGPILTDHSAIPMPGRCEMPMSLDFSAFLSRFAPQTKTRVRSSKPQSTNPPGRKARRRIFRVDE
jgi:hypothetical protein